MEHRKGYCELWLEVKDVIEIKCADNLRKHWYRSCKKGMLISVILLAPMFFLAAWIGPEVYDIYPPLYAVLIIIIIVFDIVKYRSYMRRFKCPKCESSKEPMEPIEKKRRLYFKCKQCNILYNTDCEWPWYSDVPQKRK